MTNEIYYFEDADGNHRPYRRYRFFEEHATRTPEEYPYSYDLHFLWGKRGGDCVYNDRMQQRDYEKYKKCYTEHIGSRNSLRTASKEAITNFVNAYFDEKYKVLGLVEGCNQSNGYPVWMFIIKKVK